MENSHLTRSIKQSGWKYFEKLLSEQDAISEQGGAKISFST